MSAMQELRGFQLRVYPHPSRRVVRHAGKRRWGGYSSVPKVILLSSRLRISYRVHQGQRVYPHPPRPVVRHANKRRWGGYSSVPKVVHLFLSATDQLYEYTRGGRFTLTRHAIHLSCRVRINDRVHKRRRIYDYRKVSVSVSIH